MLYTSSVVFILSAKFDCEPVKIKDKIQGDVLGSSLAAAFWVLYSICM